MTWALANALCVLALVGGCREPEASDNKAGPSPEQAKVPEQSKTTTDDQLPLTEVLVSSTAKVERVVSAGKLDNIPISTGSLIVSIGGVSGTSVVVPREAPNLPSISPIPVGSLLWLSDGRLRTVIRVGNDLAPLSLIPRYVDVDEQHRQLPTPPAIPEANDATEHYAQRFCGAVFSQDATNHPLQTVWHEVFNELTTLSTKVASDAAWQIGEDGAFTIFATLKAAQGDGFSLPAMTIVRFVGDPHPEAELFFSKEAFFGPLHLPAGTRLNLYVQDNAIIASGWFSATWLSDHVCVAPRTWTLFGTDGRLESSDFVSGCSMEFMESSIPTFSRIATSQTGVPNIIRLSVPTSLFGIDAAAGSMTCFREDGSVSSLVLNTDTNISGVQWRAGTRLMFKGPRWFETALSPSSISWRGLNTTPGKVVELAPDGTPRRLYVEGEVEVEGMPCHQIVQFFDDGKLEGCVLAAGAKMGGVALRPGWAAVTKAGHLAAGILDQDYTLGSTTLRPGSVFDGTYDERVQHVVKSSSDVQGLIERITNKIDAGVRKQLASLSKKDAFGTFGEAQVVLAATTVGYGPRKFSTTRTYRVENFLSNSPFRDCDCDVTITADVSWTVDQSRGIFVDAGLTAGSKIIVDPKSICPTGRFLLTIATLLARPIDAGRLQQVQSDISAPVDVAAALLIQKLAGAVPIVGSKLRLVDLRFVGSPPELVAEFEYARYIQ